MDIENYKSPRIIALEIDEFDEDSGVDGIALVEQPAIESDWIYFSSQKQIFQSYADYPKQAQENANIALRWADENGWGSCGTPVGKARANQLAKGEPISEETIARMAAFERHRQNSKKELGDGCGRLMWLAWGGDEGIEWAQRKLKQIRKEELDIDVSDIGDYIPTGSDIITKDVFDDEENIDVLGYNTKYFFMCPLAIEHFKHLIDMEPDEETSGMIRSLAQIADNIFRIEHDVKHEGVAELEELGEAQTLLEDFKDLSKEVDDLLGMKHDISYMDGHIDVIRGYIDDLVLEYILREIMGENKYIEELPNDVQDRILERLDEVGESGEGWVLVEDEQKFAISSKPNEPSIEDYGRTLDGKVANEIRYKYFGERDSKNRDFCAKLLDKDLVFRKEDINRLSIQGENSEFGIYDIFKYKGSYGCRHSWMKVKKEIYSDGSETTTEQLAVDESSSVNAKPTMNRNPNSETLIDKNATQSAFTKIKLDSNEKQLIGGALMIPRKLIYRFDEANGEYWVYFTESVIEKIAHKYLMNKNQDNTNLEHSEAIKLEDVILVESWLVEEPEKDKSFALTGKTYEKGTWFGIMKVKNLSVWEEWVKTGRVRGYSVEGYFSDKLINMSKTKFYYRTTKGGSEIVIDHKTLVVFILKDGERKAILPDGNYELDNGKTLKVIDSKAVEGSFNIN
jgi:hypothetical protein